MSIEAEIAKSAIATVAALAMERALKAERGREPTEEEVAKEIHKMTNGAINEEIRERGVKVNARRMTMEIRSYGE